MGSFGDNSVIGVPSLIQSPNNIFIGENVSIGPFAYLSARNAKLTIQNNVVIAGKLAAFTGNHARVPGLFINEITENNKPKGYDEEIIVESDVWIGYNVTLLSGVIVGRGSTIAAGSVVSKSIPPYCIAGGIPAHFINFYWGIEDILLHEEKCYPKEKRYSRTFLEDLFSKYRKCV